MHALRTLAAVAAVVLLAAGCATGPSYKEVQSSLPKLAPNQGRVYFYRASQPFGAGIQPSVMLNGEKVGDSKPGGFFFVDRAPGNYEVLLTTEVERKLSLTLAAGEERYVRMAVTLGVLVYRVYPELVDAATGRAEIQELSYTGSPLK